MKKMMTLGAIGLAALMTMATVSTAQDAPIGDNSVVYQAARPAPKMVDVKGKVVDAKGKAAKGALVGMTFELKDGTFGARGSASATTGEDGTFTFKVDERVFKNGDSVLQAFTADGSMTGHSIIKKTDDPSTLAEASIKLASKTVKITGTVEAPEGTEGLADCFVVARLKTKEGTFTIQISQSSGTSAQLHLPKGEFELLVLSQAKSESVQKLKPTYLDLKVDDKKPTHDLGKVKLEISPVKGGFGKPAPELNVTHSRGTTAKKIADFKGKWVLVDFWGIWCGPCIRSMPKLMEIYESNADIKDSFEIISIHNKDSNAPDLETMDKNIADRKFVENAWGGKNITWPMMIDGNDQTVRDWGVNSFPTLAIVDPEGKLHSASYNNYTKFAEILADIRAKKAGGGAADAEKKPAETEKKADSDKKPNAKAAK